MSTILFCALAGYLLGSAPFAFLVVRRRNGVDIRKAGSGNAGALNSLLVTRSRVVGAAVLLLDLSKGLAAALLAGAAAGGEFSAMGAAAVGAVTGHNYSVWLGGKGGRGLATALGAILPIAPLLGLIWMVFWAAGYAVFREINVGSAVACVATLVLLVAAPFPALRPMVLAPATAGEFSLFASALFAVLLSKLVPPVLAWARGRGKG